MVKKKISVRIDQDLLNEFVVALQGYKEEVQKISEIPTADLTITSIIESSLSYGAIHLEQQKKRIIKVNERMKESEFTTNET